MAGGYSPAAITGCWNTVKQAIPSAQLGGIYGNKPGYHNCRAQVSASDYSNQRADDKLGDAWAGSALDITLPHNTTVLMRQVTQRLIDATFANDARVRCVREFFGTVDGRTVTGLDVRDKRWVTSDASHLWHVHISFYRRFATDHAALQQVASVLVGASGTSDGSEWFEMASKADLRAVLDEYLGAKVMGGQALPMRIRRQSNRLWALLPAGDPEKAPNRNELFDAWAKRVGLDQMKRDIAEIKAAVKK